MPINVKCVKCAQVGNLTIKKTKTRGVMYEYYYLQHYIRETKKIAWCYIGSYNKLPGEYKDKVKEIETIHNYTQQSKDYTQQMVDLENLYSDSFIQNRNELTSGCGLAWSRTGASQASNPGSNPGSRTNKVMFL